MRSSRDPDSPQPNTPILNSRSVPLIRFRYVFLIYKIAYFRKRVSFLQYGGPLDHILSFRLFLAPIKLSRKLPRQFDAALTNYDSK
jgi:hypothetical protein